MRAAHGAEVETGNRVCIDRTVTETPILAPADSRLLYDGGRVLTRLLRTTRERLGSEAIVFHDHCRAAKRRSLARATRARTARADLRKLLRLGPQPA